MKQVDITTQLLIRFSTEYAKMPNVDTGAAAIGIPFTHQVLACWITALAKHQDNTMYLAFTGWLCGRNEFLDPDTTSMRISETLAACLKPLMEKDNDS